MPTGNIVSVYGGHDANITFYNGEREEIHVIEFERITQKRYFRLHTDNSRREIRRLLKESQKIAEEHFGIENRYDTLLLGSDGWNAPKYLLKQVFNFESLKTVATHHMSHAATAFYQSGYEESIVISFDGGGDDGFFNVYYASLDGIRHLRKIDCDFGGGYTFLASLIEEVTKDSRNGLALAGKLMGLCAYGENQPAWQSTIEDFFFNRDFDSIIDLLNLEFRPDYKPWTLQDYKFSGSIAYDLAATSQFAFEEAFFRVLDTLNTSLPICITGGCALNVLLNERVKLEFNSKVFIPPNPNDCGLSLGHLLKFLPPQSHLELTYSGAPLLDIDKFDYYVEEYGARKVSKSQLAKMLKQGKILGFIYGDSEIGPRALGNRSIICDPSYPEMKDVLNAKVKFREWYRPFAPICRKDDAEIYFDSVNFEKLEYMSFAPKVKEEWASMLPSITHQDGTSRLQTVTQTSHKEMFELLEAFSAISKTPILLNTSFNIRGKPILTSISDALYVLNTTELDGVVVNDFLFEKGAYNPEKNHHESFQPAN